MPSTAKKNTRIPRFLPRMLLFFMVLAALCATGPPALAAQSAPSIHINGEAFFNSTPAFLHLPGYNYVPLRDIAGALGFSCDYIAERHSAVLSRDGVSLTVDLGSGMMNLNGREIRPSVPPVLHNGRTYVGLRTLSEALGAYVEWDGKANAISITTDYETKIPVSKPLAGRTIILDPGHGEILSGGAVNPGAVGLNGLLERDVNFRIANYTAELLRGMGATVIVTRGESTGLTLAERAKMATTHKADLLVSIHNNANASRSVKGTAMYINQVSANAQQDARLANCLQKNLVAALGTKDLGLFTGSYAVLRNLPCPGILAEVAFISNPEEEKLLSTADFQKKAAAGIAAGIAEFLR
ncbi:MAG: N-acetylmuramoyl-L-alanine amidase [Clostridiales bacterium]|nr:N-acetylmuramoyl-L-alanine amidase [Clostridiales bacterium]